MTEVTQARLRAVAVASPVVVILANQFTGLIEAPILVDMARGLDLDAPGASTALSRSVSGSLLTATGTAFQLLAVLAICSYLRSAGEKLWSFLAVPLLTLGHVALAIHDGWGLILAPAIDAGASRDAMAASMGPGGDGMFAVPIAVFLVSWFVLGLLGEICLLVGIWRSHVFGPVMTSVVVLAAIASSFYPTGICWRTHSSSCQSPTRCGSIVRNRRWCTRLGLTRIREDDDARNSDSTPGRRRLRAGPFSPAARA